MIDNQRKRCSVILFYFGFEFVARSVRYSLLGCWLKKMMKKGKGKNSGLLPNSFKIISSCLKTVSANATNVASSVRSAGASVAASISSAEDDKDQVTWAGFGILELGQYVTRHVLLLGYQNGFQVFDVEDASNFDELVSRRGGPVSFLQMQPPPAKTGDHEGFGNSHPLLLVVAGDDANGTGLGHNFSHNGSFARDGKSDSNSGNAISYPTTVRFYSLRSHSYVYILRFRSSVCMIRCSSRVVAVGLATQIYCFDALTLENKFSVLTYPVPQPVRQGTTKINVGYGPMAVGPRWLAYASKSSMTMKTGRLSPQSIVSSPSLTPSTSTSGSSLMARYAMESSKQLANGLINLGDMGYKTLSKYYQDMLPDGSTSPASPNSIWKAGGVSGSDAENAGMVSLKDLVSGAVISQFKAHTSPISALCFDPSGTLLVTASVCGNNINVFQIMPSRSHSAPGDLSYEWESSHVHLYKLHRGITSAIVQDICFSQQSQWVAIISSKGTCHIFVLNPSGSDAAFQPCEGEEPLRLPASSLPWWFSQSLSNSQYSVSPPPAVALSVVSRIKYSSFGWLNTVNNAATAATGKVFVPSGAVAAVFHKSVTHDLQQNSQTKSLEHILVYTPSGHVVQHELLPSVCTESPENGLSVQRTSHVRVQEDDLRVKVEPIQWWDVCRRSDWLETEERLPKSITERRFDLETVSNNLTCHKDECHSNSHSGEDMRLKTCSEKPPERSHCYLSNFEVKVTSGILPVWQNSKISFHVMNSQSDDSSSGGEFEIEKVPTHELEIKQKKLLPVFDHFHSTKATLEDRFSMKCYHMTAPGSHQVNGKMCQDIINCRSKPGSVESTGSSEEGSSKQMENLHDLDHMKNSFRSSSLYPTVNGVYKEIEKNNTNGWIEKPVTAKLSTQIRNGFSTPPSHTDATVNDQMVSNGKLTMNFGFALREEHCKADADPKEEEPQNKLDEVTNGHHLKINNNTDKLQGDEIVPFVGD